MPTGDFPDPEGMVWTDANGWVPAGEPKFIVCHPVQAAVIDAYQKFGGRDWRRVKREVNKAIKRAERDKGDG